MPEERSISDLLRSGVHKEKDLSGYNPSDIGETPAATSDTTGAGSAGKKPPCRFTMTVRLPENSKITFHGKRIWTFRGDKYSEQPNHQLRTLLNQFKNHWRQYMMAYISDNTKPIEDGEVCIYKYLKGRVTVNRLEEYSLLLKDYCLPKIIEQ
jgi:hypothetical protein